MKFDKLSKEEEERAINIYKKSIVVDGQNPSVMSEEYFQRMREAGLTAAFVLACEVFDVDFWSAMRSISELYSLIEKSRDNVLLATSIEDIKRAKKDNKVALILDFGTPNPIEDDLNLLTIFYRLGIRVIQLTWNERSLIGDGCAERTNCGLSDFGVQVVEEMNRLGIIIDLSHSGIATALETIELSEDPITFSHSNVRSLFDNRRNVTDEVIKAVADKKGVIGVIPSVSFLGAGVKKPLEEITIEDLLDHIDYIVKLVGVDYVGFGSDFAEGLATTRKRYVQKYPSMVPYAGIRAKHIDKVSKLPNLAKGLVARGYSDKEIEKILGGNFLRLIKRVF